MTKANDRRVKMALEQTRPALKSESQDLEKRRREYGREREQLVAALRIICGLYGDNSWTEETPLPVVVEQHLGAVLAREMRAVREHVADLEARVRRAESAFKPGAGEPILAAPAPTPLRPTLLPEIRHNPLVVPFELRGERGFRIACTCPWRSPFFTTQEGAQVAGQAHVTQAELTRREATR
jgi:hypothetical protein